MMATNLNTVYYANLVKVYETELDLANQSEDQYQIDKARLKFCAAKVLEANQNYDIFNEYQDWCYQLIQQYLEMVKDESINKESDLTIIIGSKAITINCDCRLNSTSHAFVRVTDLYLA
jgi:hypothetical protein